MTDEEQAVYDAARLVRLADAGGWIGVDLDGTLAEYGGFKGHGHIGAPIPAMVARVKGWLVQGIEVRIFTARASSPDGVPPITQWCVAHLGADLRVTNQKDHLMIELWDDRAVQVVPNTGRRADGRP